MTYLLIAIVFILFIVLSVQLVRVGELLSRIKGQDPNEVTDKDNNTQGILFLVVGFGFIAFVLLLCFGDFKIIKTNTKSCF